METRNGTPDGEMPGLSSLKIDKHPEIKMIGKSIAIIKLISQIPG